MAANEYILQCQIRGRIKTLLGGIWLHGMFTGQVLKGIAIAATLLTRYSWQLTLQSASTSL